MRWTVAGPRSVNLRFHLLGLNCHCSGSYVPLQLTRWRRFVALATTTTFGSQVSQKMSWSHQPLSAGGRVARAFTVTALFGRRRRKSIESRLNQCFRARSPTGLLHCHLRTRFFSIQCLPRFSYGPINQPTPQSLPSGSLTVIFGLSGNAFVSPVRIKEIFQEGAAASAATSAAFMCLSLTASLVLDWREDLNSQSLQKSKHG